MTEKEALARSQELLQAKEITLQTARDLKKLEPYIQDHKMGDLWEAFVAVAPPEVFTAWSKI